MSKDRKEISSKYKWDLSLIYDSDKETTEEVKIINNILDNIITFNEEKANDAKELKTFLEDYFVLKEKIETLCLYSRLNYYQDMTSEEEIKFYEKTNNFYNEYINKTSFIYPLLLKIDYKKLLDNDKNLELYDYMFENMQRYNKYTLSEKEEQIIAKTNDVRSSSYDVFNNLNNADIDFGYITDESGKRVKLTRELYAQNLKSFNSSIRKKTYNKMLKYYEKHKNTIGSLYKANIKSDYFISNIKGYKDFLEKSLYSDSINKDVYLNLINTTKNKTYILEKYYKLKQQYFKLDSLNIYDLALSVEDNNEIVYEDAKDLVVKSLNILGDDYITNLNNVFTEKRIDIYPNKNKRSGAYCSLLYKKPYVSLNYNNDLSSVYTLAHELGHAVHTYYSDYNQSFVYRDYPIFLAEIASKVNEILLFDYLYKNAKDNKEKIKHLFSFIDTAIGTLFSQTMFAEFELLAHDLENTKKAITANTLSDIYENLIKQYNPGVKITPLTKYSWMRIPHFYTSFYVYKYATGLISSFALVQNILDNEHDGLNNYITFLKAGASKAPLEILLDASVDLTDPETTNKAYNYLESLVDKLQNLINLED